MPTSVNVIGTLTLPSGLPAAGATIRFTLSNPGLLGVTVVLPTNVKAVANAAGQFSVALVPNPPHSYYTVTVYKSVGVVLLESVVVIPAHDCQFSNVLQTRPSSITASIAALAQLQEAQASIEQARLEITALVSSSTSATQQAAINQLSRAIDACELSIVNMQSLTSGLVEQIGSLATAIAADIGDLRDTIDIMKYSTRTDFDSDFLIYKGEAAPGSGNTDQVWRIHRLIIGGDGDVTEEWAGGTAAFDRRWSDRLTYSYS